MKLLQSSFKRTLRAGAFAFITIGLIASNSAVSAQSSLSEKHYDAVKEPITVSTGDKIEVAELFWFGCGHCYSLEPHLKSWLANKPDNAEFRKVPAIFSKRWEFHGKAFYTMEALGVPEQAYDDFFKAIHVKRQRMNTLEALVRFLEGFGKDKEAVESAFNSFAVDSKLRNAMKITRASGATGVPAIIVDGKYRTSQNPNPDQNIKLTPTEMFNVVDQLVVKAAEER